MSVYNHILLASDFSEDSQAVTDKAVKLSQQFNCRLSLIHVINNLPVTDAIYGAGISYDSEFAEELKQAANKKMTEFAETIRVDAANRFLELGSPKLEIVRIADEIGADLIVLGSHGRHGLGLLLGSTANGVLHHAHCDVLAVRLLENDTD